MSAVNPLALAQEARRQFRKAMNVQAPGRYADGYNTAREQARRTKNSSKSRQGIDVPEKGTSLPNVEAPNT